MATNVVVCINLLYNNPILNNSFFDNVCKEIIKNHNKILFVVADKIAFYTYVGFYKLDENDAINKANTQGNIIFKKLMQFRNKSEYRGRIIISKWSNIKTNKYKADILTIVNEYINNDQFKVSIDKIAEKLIMQTNKHYPFKTNHIQRSQYIAKYIMSELPLLLDGILYKNTVYNQIFCIKYKDLDENIENSTEKLVDGIIENKLFPNLHKILYHNSDQHTILVEK